MAATARQKRLYLHHQGEFQHKNCTLGSLNDSDHDGVGRFFVGLSQGSVRLINYLFTLDYAAQFFLYQECNSSQCPYKSQEGRLLSTTAATNITSRLYSASL